MEKKAITSWPRQGRTSPLHLHTACLIIASIAYTLVIANVAEGATYYVDDANGSDANPGTEAQPWLTIPYTSSAARGENTVAEGDTVLFKNGDYGEFRETGLAANRTDWVTYAAAGAHEPNLTNIYVTNGDHNTYLKWDGFNVKGGAELYAVTLYHGSYFNIHDCNITTLPLDVEGYYAPYYASGALAQYCIYATSNVDYVTIEDCQLSYAYRGIRFGGGGEEYWTIKNNVIHRYAEDAIRLDGASHVLIEDNLIYDTEGTRSGFGLTGTGSGTWELGETVIQAGSNAEGIIYELGTVNHVHIYTTSQARFLITSAGGGTVTGQTSEATMSPVTLCDYAHSDAIQAVSSGAMTDIVIRGNVLHPGQSNALLFTLYGNTTDFTIENNLAWGQAGNDLQIGGVASGLQINNNTFIDGMIVTLGGQTVTPTIVDELYNNIILKYLTISSDSGTAYVRVVSHGNNIFGVNPNGQGGPTYPFALNSTEAVTINLNALFTNAAGNDYTLAAGSAAINFGNAAYGPTTDKNGNARVGAPDAGCYEYVSSGSGNHAPVLESIGSKSVNENAALTFTISAADADSDTITYSAQNLPTGATFSGQTFAWTPGYTQAGAHNVTFVASDGTNQDSELVTITVSNVNRAPVLASIGSKSVNENALLTFTTSATDADGDTIIYSASDLPTGATFSGQTFAWTPGYTQAGPYEVTFTASDGTDTDSETITMTVSNVNRAPVLATIDNKSVSESSLLSFSLSATDADGDTVTYTASSLPAGSAFAGSTFTWTPGYTQAGSFQVTLTASDSQATDSQAVTITVNNVNRAPVLDAIADKSVNETTLLTFTVNATDPDGDPLSYSATGLPSGATFTGQTFNWTPAHSQTDNSYQVTFTASDGQLDDSQTVTIAVSDTSAPNVANCSPPADSIQAPLNNLITLHITDDGKGVNAGTVTITLDGSTIYSGDTSNYVSATGNCRRTGTKADYTYAYQPSADFDFDQTKTVTVNATDLGGNVMSGTSYSFRTEMRSFGENKLLGSDVANLAKGAPATATDSSSNIWAVWHAGPTGSRDIYLAKLAAGASAFGASTQITDSNADQCNPAIAVGTDDKLYVVWEDNRRGNWDVYASTSMLGTTWSAPQRLTDSNDNQINPALAVDSQSPNRVYVVWQDDSAGNEDIYLATSSNAFVTNTLTRITSNTADQTDPAVAVDSSNTVYVLWTDGRNSSNDIYGAAGSGWTNVPIVTKAADQSSPAIAVESTGSILHLLWADRISGNSDIYYASCSGLPSSPLTGTNIVDDTSDADQLSPTIVVAGSAGSGLKVFACWLDKRNVAGTNGDTDLYMVQTNVAHGTNVLIDDGGMNSAQSEPAIGIDRYGYPYMVWTDDRNTGTEIYYAASTYMQPTAVSSQHITASSGGTVGADPNAITSADDVSIVVPAGACPYDVTISITKIENPQEFATRQLSSYDFGPSGIEFSRPVTVTIPYAVASSGTSPSAYWYDSLTGALSQQGITDIEIIELSATLQALRFKTTHFTPYVVLAAGATAGAAGGGGGGGGGCSMSPHQGAEWPDGQSNVVEFLVPYLGLAVVMLVLKLRDARNRRPQGPLAGARGILKGQR